jgi:hypothetical protein
MAKDYPKNFFLNLPRGLFIFKEIFSVGATTLWRNSSNAAEAAPGRISELCRGRYDSWLKAILKSRAQI